MEVVSPGVGVLWDSACVTVGPLGEDEGVGEDTSVRGF